MEKVVNIIRIEDGADGVFGVVLYEGKYVCVSLEPHWRDNEPNVSCIPEGSYLCRRRENWFGSGKWGYTYEVEGVPERDGILFHPANWVVYRGRRLLEGCIAPGTSIMNVGGVRGVGASTPAFKKLRSLIGDDLTFNLNVVKLIL